MKVKVGEWEFEGREEYRFCLAYYRLGDPGAAWLAVHPNCSDWRVASASARRKLGLPRIRAYLQWLMERAQERAIVDTAKILAEEVGIAHGNVQDLYDPGWVLKDNADLPEHVAKGIKGVEVDEVYSKEGVLVKKRVKLTREDKGKALERLEKMAGLLETEQMKVSNTVIVVPQEVRKDFLLGSKG
jgi:hypothetical protein